MSHKHLPADLADSDLTAALRTIERAATPSADFTQRLLDRSADRAAASPVNAWRNRKPGRAWAPMLAAAAAVVALVATALIWTAQTGAQHVGNPPTAPSEAPAEVLPGARVLPAATGLPSGFSGNKVRFTDASHGWMLGDAPCDNGETSTCPVLALTADGGASWTTPALPEGLPALTLGCMATAETPCVNNLTVVAEQTFYLWGPNAAWVTSDAGHQWTKVERWKDVTGVAVVTDQVFRFAQPAVAPDALPDAGTQLTIAAAAPGSVEFAPVASPAGPKEVASDIVSSGPGHLLLWLIDVTAGKNKLLSTTDGVTWRPVDPGVCGGYFVQVVGGAADGTAAVVCQDMNFHLIARDGKATRRGTLPAGANASRWWFEDANRFAVDFYREPTQPGVAAELNWLVTDNGGRSFQRQDQVPADASAQNFGGTTAPDGRVATVASLGTVLVTSDDLGRTWSQRSLTN